MEHQHISPEAEQQRESVRGRDGKFGVQIRETVDANIDLDAATSLWSDDPAQIAEIMSVTRHTAISMTGGRSIAGMDVDDFVQEAMTYCLKASKSRDMGDSKAAVLNFVRHYIRRAGMDPNGANRKASHEYQSWEKQYLSQNAGRRPSQAETDAKCAEIIAGWHDQNRKPTPDFLTRNEQRRTSSIYSESGENLAETGEAVPVMQGSVLAPGEQQFAGGTLIELALDEKSGHLWRGAALCEATGVVLPRAGGVRRSQAHKLRSQANKWTAEGSDWIGKAVKDWESGEDSPETAALFAPWGEQDPSDLDRVAGVIYTAPDRAEQLWLSALAFADERNSPKIAAGLASTNYDNRAAAAGDRSAA